jgi:hypothetical protein
MERPDTGLEAGARAKWTDDGLLISTLIDESEDKGTFQTLFLLDCAGRRLYPASLEIYRIWVKGAGYNLLIEIWGQNRFSHRIENSAEAKYTRLKGVRYLFWLSGPFCFHRAK